VNHGNACAHGSSADHQLSAARDQRGLADFDAGNVRDGVECTRRSADGELEVTLSRLLCLQRDGKNNDREQAQD